MKYKDVLRNEEIKAFLKKGNENLGLLGYTDHSEKYCAIVAKRAGSVFAIAMGGAYQSGGGKAGTTGKSKIRSIYRLLLWEKERVR